MKPILISACLVGLRTRYDGSDVNLRERFINDGNVYMPVCPEQLGGLTTPREPAEIKSFSKNDINNRRCIVLTRNTGKDVSEEFYRGAEEVLALCRRFGITEAVMKAGSPSCGSEGITAIFLEINGITVHYEA